MPFPSTHWSALAKATLNDEADARAAFDDLCRRYWPAMKEFVRAHGYGDEDAADLTQDFLVHVVEHSTLRAADRSRGLFRSFLSGALKRFLSDEFDRRRAQKRGRGQQHQTLEGLEEVIPTPNSVESATFDREWAMAILESVQQQVEAEIQRDGNTLRLEVLRRFLPGSLTAPTYEAAAAELASSVPALTSEVHRLRTKFKALLRQEVARTVSAPHELEEEMAYLQCVLMDRGNDFCNPAKGS